MPRDVHPISHVLKLSQKVTIDACQVFGPDTVFLQQAAHLTGGAYLYLERRDALLQYLIVSPSIPNSPSILIYPFQDDVSPSFIDTQGHGSSHARQNRFPCSVFLSQEYHRYRLCLFCLFVQYVHHYFMPDLYSRSTSSILSTGPSLLHLPVCSLSQTRWLIFILRVTEQNSRLKHCSVLMHLALCRQQSQALRGPPRSAHPRFAHHQQNQPASYLLPEKIRH